MQYIIIYLLSLTLYSSALADTIQGKVVKIADGDTVTVSCQLIGQKMERNPLSETL